MKRKKARIGILMFGVIFAIILIILGTIVYFATKTSHPNSNGGAICGNNVCEFPENSDSCPQDCGANNGAICGNDICEYPENSNSCPQDCGTSPPQEYCGDGICQSSESKINCPEDCGEYCTDWQEEYSQWEYHCDSWSNPICNDYWECEGNNKVRDCYEIRNCYKTKDLYEFRFCDSQKETRKIDTITENYQETNEWIESKYNEWCYFYNVRPSSHLSCGGYIDCDNWRIKQKAEELKEECENGFLGLMSLIPDSCSPEDLLKKDWKWVRQNIEYDESFGLQTTTITASEVLRIRKGVCSHYSILLASLARAQGIPTKVMNGCAVPDCDWWEFWCSVPRFIVGDTPHAWNQGWVYNWKYVDTGLQEYGTKASYLEYYNINDISYSCETGSVNCFLADPCRY